MASSVHAVELIFGSAMRLLFAIVLPLLIVGGLSLAPTQGSAHNSPFKQLTSSDASWDHAQDEVEIASNQLELEAEWVERLIGILSVQEFAAPLHITVHTEARLPIFSPVAKYGRLFSLPPPV
ncbi:MAG: hypothetical protein EOP09_10540 [Proteobacteria bacterium]|nr:MAG: hypothetical protein EOP09_10540 [Pseudomonadota bacterium]